ncbi:MAG: ABC transporter substrate-binding protein [Clostridia bacterium]|nr:ABC transporter substrate-binding protein [Clostridia bacterium]
MKKICFALIISVALLLCGCGDDKAKKQNISESDIINLQMGMPDNLNPLKAQKQSVRDAMLLCYEPLFEVDEKIEISGVLAEDCKISDDSFSAVIKLKDSVLWHDGKKFTSGDVCYTIDYLKNNPDSPYAFCVEYIESVTAIDSLMLRLKLSRPYAQIAHSLYFPIIPAHIENIDKKIVGTGPYIYKNYIEASSLELAGNENWHGGEVKTKKIKCSVVRDNIASATAFNTGIIDAVTKDYFDLSNNVIKSNMRSVRFPSSKFEFMVFNHNSPLLKSSALRVAISLALNRAEIVEDAYGSNAVAANVPIHPESEIASALTSTEYNLNNALEMFFLEGYSKNEKTGLLQNSRGEKLKFTIKVNEENSQRVKCAELIKQQLLKAGIEVRIVTLSFEEYQKAIESGQFEAYIGGVKSANIYDFEYLLSKNGTLNTFGYDSKYMELSLSAIANAPSVDSLENALMNFDEVYTREQPICTIAYLSDVLITNDKVMGKLLPRLNSPYANIKNWSVK